MRYFSLVSLFMLLAVFHPHVVSAHQPQVVTRSPVTVAEPEISKAYYGELAGVPHVYVIDSASPFRLYVGLLVPAAANPDGRYGLSVSRIETDGSRTVVADVPAGEETWKLFHEPFGNDDYLQGPELRQDVLAGHYEIVVGSVGDRGKYVLAVGDVESFPMAEVWRSLTVIPHLKSDFFGVSPVTFAFSIFGGAYLLMSLLAGAALGWFARLVSARFGKPVPLVRRLRNLGLADRLARLALAIVLLCAAVLTTWNVLLLLASGFVFFEAVSRWCVLYAYLGRNTCPAV